MRRSVFFSAAAILVVSGTAVSAAPHTTLFVPQQYATIQGAINAARAGDTVVVGPGTYPEQLSIDKSLRLIGAGARATTVRAPSVLTPSALGRNFLVDVHGGAQVTIAGITVRGPGPNACGRGSLNAGVKVTGNATLDFSGSRVLDIVDTPASSCRGTAGAIVVGDFVAAQVGHATIHDVTVNHYQDNGIAVFGHGSDATVTDNLIDAALKPGEAVISVGVQIGDGAFARVRNNVIGGNECNTPDIGCGADPMNNVQSSAFSAGTGDPPAPRTEFAHNIVIQNDVGIYLFFVDDIFDVHDNVLINNRYFGIAIQDSSSTVSHDVILGGDVGVGVIADFIDSVGTLEHETILGTTGAATRTLQCCGVTATILRD
jgi:parallel beta-helix repeat protein